jgi:hypothetical protein
MNFDVSIKGLDDVQNQLDMYSKKLKSFPKEDKVTLRDVLNESFINEYTEFKSLEDLEKKFNSINKKGANKDVVDTPEWNKYIANHTKFDDWDDMINNAIQVYIVTRISNILD